MRVNRYNSDGFGGYTQTSDTVEWLDGDGAAYAFDLYQFAVHGGEDGLKGSASELTAVISELGCQTVLDCAAGTGVPSLYMEESGLQIHYTDGDEAMVRRFNHNASRLGLSATASTVKWSELGQLEDRYDCVVCLGNSLAYDSVWNRTDETPHSSRLEESLASIAGRVQPGGYMLVDAPTEVAPYWGDANEEEFRAVIAPDHQRFDRTGRVSVNEYVKRSPAPTGVPEGVRLWRPAVLLDFLSDGMEAGQPCAEMYCFDQFAANIDIGTVVHAIESLGFVLPNSSPSATDRQFHSLVIAQKPAEACA